jgi:hypothetical protein
MKKLLRIMVFLLAIPCLAQDTNWYYMVYFPTGAIPLIGALGSNYTNDPASTVITNDPRLLTFQQVAISNLTIKGTNIQTLINSPSNNLQGTSLAIGTNTPRSQIHLFGTNDVADEFNRMPNGIIIDGTGLGDQALDFWINGEPRWSDYIYRNEGGEFKYWYNYQSQKDIFVASRSGRFGINRPSNIMDYHSMFTGSGLNDLYIGGIYQYRFSVVAIVTIDGTNAVADTYKVQYSLDNGSTFVTYATGQVISAGVETSVGGGVTVMFNSQTGHQTNDSWLTVCHAQNPQGTFSISPPKIEEILIKTNLSVESYQDVTFEGNSMQYGNVYPLRTGTNSAIYLGGTWPWSGIYANVVTGAVGVKMVWEYWTGTNWYPLVVGVNYYQDYSADLSISGKIVWDTATMPNWSSTNLTVDTYTNQYYWMRGRSTNNVTTVPCISAFSRHAGARLLVYNAHGDNKPAFSVVDDGTVTMGDYRFTQDLLQTFYWKFKVTHTVAITAVTASIIVPFTNELTDGYNVYSNNAWWPGTTNLCRMTVSMKSADNQNAGRGFYVEFYENNVKIEDLFEAVSGDNSMRAACNFTHIFNPANKTNYYQIGVRRYSANDVIMAGGRTNWWYGEKIQ